MTDLTDRMRTCAAAMAHDAGPDDAHWQWQRKYRDACDLLIEASNALEAIPEPLGEPMALLEPKPPAAAAKPATETAGQWYGAGDTLPAPREGGPPSYRHPRVCPKCDSRASKRVFREGAKVMLACPVCATTWEYRP